MPNRVEKRPRVGRFGAPDQGTGAVSRTRSEAAGAGQGHGWSRSSQRRHRTGPGPGRADEEGRERRAGDGGPPTGDMSLTGSRAAAGARARQDSDEAGNSEEARLWPGHGG